MKLVYMIPFYISNTSEEIQLARYCFDSLDLSDDVEVVIFNQGYMNNEEIKEFMKPYKMKYHILGIGENVGIAMSRYKTLEYIFNLPYEVDYIGEIHIDMIFTPNWHKPLVEYLENSDEPMLCVRTAGYDELPEKFEDKIKYLQSQTFDDVSEGFVHPAIHKAKILKEINPYDVGYFTGKQGYEDDAILLGYSYYVGRQRKWRPKAMSNSCVAHKGAAQRFKMGNRHVEFDKNLNGLNTMYGGMGFKELSRIHNNSEYLYNIYKQTIMDKEAYNYDINKPENKIDTSNIYTSRFIVVDDKKTDSFIINLPNEWYSRKYEYLWAINFVSEDDIVLDAGCGVEYPFKFYLANKCKATYACDVDERLKNKDTLLESINNIFGKGIGSVLERYLEKLILVQENLAYLRYENNSFDKIFCIDILHNMDEIGQKIVLENLYRMLKPNGLLIITFTIPYVSLEYISGIVRQIGFNYAGEIDKRFPSNALQYSEYNFSCFRMLLRK